MFPYLTILFLIATISLVSAACTSTELRGYLTGLKPLLPGDQGFTSASAAFNLRYDITPAAIVSPSSASQVGDAVKAGVECGLPVVARSGGHSYIANGLGGGDGFLVVDLKNLNEVKVDPTTHIAAVGTGERLGAVALALNDTGRDTAHGTCPYVGLGGHASYGGYGYASRMWGLALDNIVSMDVVLVDGSIVTADRSQNADLFWAMLGAGGSFGIATTMYMRTYEQPPAATVFQYNWNLNAEESASALAAYQTFCQTNVSIALGIRHELRRGTEHGYVNHSITGTWFGDKNDFDAVIDPLLKHLPPNPVSYVSNGTYIDSLVYFTGKGLLDTSKPDQPDTFYAKSLVIPEDTPMTINALKDLSCILATEGFTSNTSWFLQIELWGGGDSVINVVPSDATSFVHRDSLFVIQFYASAYESKPPFPEEGFYLLDNAVNSIIANMATNWDYGTYTDYIDGNLTSTHWYDLYYGSNYPRLQALKKHYDPQSTFGAFPLGIEPLNG